MSLQAHLDALKERHAALELRISDEDQRPRPDSETLHAAEDREAAGQGGDGTPPRPGQTEPSRVTPTRCQATSSASGIGGGRHGAALALQPLVRLQRPRH